MEKNNVNYMHVVSMTKDQIIDMYMKLKKRELAEMLYNCNILIQNKKSVQYINTQRNEDC